MRAVSCSRKGICTSMIEDMARERAAARKEASGGGARSSFGFGAVAAFCRAAMRVPPLDLLAAGSALSPILPPPIKRPITTM